MATSRFYCYVCLKDFHFSSRYERHIRSSSHRRLEKVFSLQDDAISHQSAETCSQNNLDDSAVQCSTVEVASPDLSENEDGVEDNDDHCNSYDADFHETELISDLVNVATDDDDFSPFSSKLHALSFMLLNSPRPVGESNLVFIFFILRQLDATLPSLSSLKLFRLPHFASPKKHLSSKGVPFYTNSVCGILKRCLGNPYIASCVARYPTVPNEYVREIFYGQRWRTDAKFITPMVCLPFAHVYIKDFVNFLYNRKVLLGSVSEFFHKEGESGVFATVIHLRAIEQDSYFIGNDIIIPVTDILCVVRAPHRLLRRTENSTLLPLPPSEYSNFTAPHPLKSIAGPTPVIVLPIILYSDDTSGNKSKRWNKFDSWCVKLAGLPNDENQKFSNIYHISSSNKVDCIELAVPMVEELLMLEEKGVMAYDVHEKKEVLVVAPVLCIICDNPRASEVTNNLGPGSRMFCRMCMADRDQNPDIVGDMRSKHSTLQQMALISSQVTTREKNGLKTQFGIKNQPNPLLKLSLDLHRSTPVETLHTVLLGPYKYLLSSLMQRLSSAEKEQIEARLGSLDYSGMDYRLSYSIVRHFKSFIGRDYKALAQIALHILTPYMTPNEKVVWLALSKVFQISYCQQFKLSDYDENKKICEAFVKVVHEYFPDLKKKIKIHLLLHLADNMIDFGPTSAYNTERCESFNGLIRSKNIYSNRLSPSRDIAHGFAVLEHLRFISSGGTFDGVRCGKGLTSLYNSPAVQSFLNGVGSRELQGTKAMYQPGSLRKLAFNSHRLDQLKVTVKGQDSATIHQLINDPHKTILLSSIPVDTSVTSASAVVGRNGSSQLIHVGDSVKFYAHPTEVDMGILAACFTENSGLKYCILQLYESLDSFGTQVLNEYDCPLYSLTSTFCCVPSSSIISSVSFFHECSSSCTFSHTNSVSLVERETVTTHKFMYLHDYQCSLYFLNLYCMHQ